MGQTQNILDTPDPSFRICAQAPNNLWPDGILVAFIKQTLY